MTISELRAQYDALSGRVDEAQIAVKAAREGVFKAQNALSEAENALWSAQYDRRACEDLFFWAVQCEEAEKEAK